MRTRTAVAVACALSLFLAAGARAQRQNTKAAAKTQSSPPAGKSAPERTGPERQSSDAAILQYRAAVAFHNKQQYDFAVDEWKRFLEKFPDDPLAAKAQHYAGVCYLQLKKPEEAIAAFERLTSKFPAFDLLDQAY